MSVQQLRTPVMAGWVGVARESIEVAAGTPVGSLCADELSEVLVELSTLEAQVGSLKLAVLAEADDRKLAEEAAATGTEAWAAKLTGTTRAVMSGGLWLARMLRERYDATREAFAAGGINEAQARVIVRAAEKLPDSVTDEQRADAEAALVAKAVDGMDARRLRQAARRMCDVISREAADQHEADQLEAEERHAEAETWMTLNDNGDGTFSGRFIIPELHGHMLRTFLERLSAPRRLHTNEAGETVVDETVDTGADTLSWTEKLGAAFCELIEHLPTEGFGNVAATLNVHLDFEHLLNGLGSARLDTGARISAGLARRLACGAGIVPMVFNGRSLPLDVGREQRLHTRAMRRALSAVYDTCSTEGCDRPFAWCEIHHPKAWAEGGPTSVENGRPLCGHHHRRAHDKRFTMGVLPNGEIRFRRRHRPGSSFGFSAA
jgi:hypothetical protein